MFNAVVGALRINLSADSAQLSNGIASANRSLEKFGKGAARLGGVMSAAFAPIGLGLFSAVRVAGDFQAAMNRVGAALGASDEQMGQLNAKAKELGRTTSFSASQAAEAIEVLAKNGLSAAQILGGALDASLTLAGASSADLGSAADLATDVMLNFGMKAEDLKGVVDGVTGTMLQSKFGFDDYRLALAQAGGVAGGLGVPFSEFNASIAATSSAFASGSDAGTSFKTFLQRLVPASKPAQEAMDSLGLKFFNANGSMKSMSEVAQELQNGLAGLSDEARNDALSTIFGTDAMRTALGLAREGAAGIDRLTDAIGKASAADQAAARLKGFNGALTKLKSAFEGLQIAIAESGLLEFLTSFVEHLTEWVSMLAEVNPDIMQFGVVLGGLGVVIAPLIATLGLFAAGIAAISLPVAAVTAGVAVLAAGLAVFWDRLFDGAEKQTSFAGASDDVTRALGDEITQTQALKQVLATNTSMSLQAAEQKLREAKARRENALAAIEEQRAMVLASAEYGRVRVEMANAEAAVKAIYAGPEGQVPVVKREAYEAAQQSLVNVLNVQRALIETEQPLIDQANATRENIAALEAAISAAKGDAVTFGSGSVVPIVPGARDAGGGSGGGGEGKSGKTAIDKSQTDAERAIESLQDMTRRVEEQGVATTLTGEALVRYEAHVEAVAVAADGMKDATDAQKQALLEAIPAFEEASLKTYRLEEASRNARDLFSGLGDEITGPFKSALKSGELSFNTFADALIGIGERLADKLIERAFKPIEAGLDALFSGSGKGGGGGSSIFGSILQAVIGGAIGGAAGSIGGGVGAVGGEAVSPSLGTIGSGAPSIFSSNPLGYASGTNFHPGGLAITSEGGPELLNLPRGTRVHTASATERMLRSAEGGDQRLAIDMRLSDDLDGRIAQGAERVALRVYRNREPETVRKSVKATYEANSENPLR